MRVFALMELNCGCDTAKREELKEGKYKCVVCCEVASRESVENRRAVHCALWRS